LATHVEEKKNGNKTNRFGSIVFECEKLAEGKRIEPEWKCINEKRIELHV